METLASFGEFTPPPLTCVEDALQYGLSLQRERVFVDLWDLRRGAGCAHCYEPRIARLHTMNLKQKLLGPVSCDLCGAAA